MNITKASIKGIDIAIQAMQTKLYDGLKTTWALTDQSFAMYGRAYRNQTDDGYTPEVYVGNNEYKDVLFDDTVAALAFFGVGETIPVTKGQSTADIFVIFMVNLDKLKAGVVSREDEEVRVDVEKLCATPFFGFSISGFQTGLEAVFKEYSGWKKKTGIQFRDQHPKHCFRINFKLMYTINQC